MIACENPKILVNPGVYDAVAFTHKIYCSGEVIAIHNCSTLFRHELYRLLISRIATVTQDNIDDYYCYNRFGHKVGLYICVPCRSCLLCAQSDENEISQRLIFEASCYKDEPYFLTLTFAKRAKPKDNLPTQRHIDTFMKRCREHAERLYHVKVRFYAQGERGAKKGRAHLHCLIFGFPTMPNSLAQQFFQSCWLTPYYGYTVVKGQVLKKRLPIGYVYCSQINDKHYAAYYEQKHGRKLNPSDGLRYCCKYGSKYSLCRSWSLGLGKAKALSLRPAMLSVCKQSFIRPDWHLCTRDKYGKTVNVIMSRWFLHTVFKTFNRSTYYYRNKIRKYILYLVTMHKDYASYFPLIRYYADFIGVNLNDLVPGYCRKSFHKILERYAGTPKYISVLHDISNPRFIIKQKPLPDFSALIQDTELYNNFCKLYFGSKPELTSEQLQLRLYQRKKYLNKQQTLITL